MSTNSQTPSPFRAGSLVRHVAERKDWQPVGCVEQVITRESMTGRSVSYLVRWTCRAYGNKLEVTTSEHTAGELVYTDQAKLQAEGFPPEKKDEQPAGHY